MRFDVVSIFPEMVAGAASYGVTGRAIERQLVSLNVWNPRDYTEDRHRTVDDRPYGGGPGMVMKYPPLHDAVRWRKRRARARQSGLFKSSRQVITQALLSEASQSRQLILVAGRYEGVDERFVEFDCDEEWSLGDYVISGGELAALIVIDGNYPLVARRASAMKTPRAGFPSERLAGLSSFYYGLNSLTDIRCRTCC